MRKNQFALESIQLSLRFLLAVLTLIQAGSVRLLFAILHRIERTMALLRMRPQRNSMMSTTQPSTKRRGLTLHRGILRMILRRDFLMSTSQPSTKKRGLILHHGLPRNDRGFRNSCDARLHPRPLKYWFPLRSSLLRHFAFYRIEPVHRRPFFQYSLYPAWFSTIERTPMSLMHVGGIVDFLALFWHLISGSAVTVCGLSSCRLSSLAFRLITNQASGNTT
jgi:hypothetical protein